MPMDVQMLEPTLHDQDFVCVGDIQEFCQVCLHLVHNFRGQLATMRVFCQAPNIISNLTVRY